MGDSKNPSEEKFWFCADGGGAGRGCAGGGAGGRGPGEHKRSRRTGGFAEGERQSFRKIVREKWEADSQI